MGAFKNRRYRLTAGKKQLGFGKLYHIEEKLAASLEQFQEKCERFSREAHGAFPWELRQNKELERFAVSTKR
jgi:hypothetical protein